jgi:hypothetical protein
MKENTSCLELRLNFFFQLTFFSDIALVINDTLLIKSP